MGAAAHGASSSVETPPPRRTARPAPGAFFAHAVPSPPSEMRPRARAASVDARCPQIGLAANAFLESIHSKKCVKLGSSGRPIPHDSLLNRAKQANARKSVSLIARLTGARHRAKAEDAALYPTVIQHGESALLAQRQEEESMATVIQRANRKKRAARLAGVVKSAAPAPAAAASGTAAT